MILLFYHCFPNWEFYLVVYCSFPTNEISRRNIMQSRGGGGEERRCTPRFQQLQINLLIYYSFHSPPPPHMVLKVLCISQLDR